MSIEKDKSEIAASFKSLLKRADEMALDKSRDDYIERFNLDENDKNHSDVKSNQNITSSKKIKTNFSRFF